MSREKGGLSFATEFNFYFDNTVLCLCLTSDYRMTVGRKPVDGEFETADVAVRIKSLQN